MKNVQLRHFAFTCNNYNYQSYRKIVSARRDLDMSYLIFGKEVGEVEKTPHLQGYVQLAKRKYLKAIIASLPNFHITICNGSSQQNIDYCKEDGDWLERGISRTQEKRNADQKSDWSELIEYAVNNEVDVLQEIAPRQFVQYYRTFKSIAVDNLKAKAIDRKCLWVYGEPGTGKSKFVHDHYPNAYWKNANKWWDSYKGEKVVVLDDLGTHHLFELLKRWADRYPVLGEVKGSSIGLTYETLIITSNFSIKELGGQEVPTVTQESVARRFLQVKVLHQDPAEDLVVLKYGGVNPQSLRMLMSAEGFSFD